MEFEWDPRKAEHNKRKHHVSFETATRVFLDRDRLEFDEPDDDDAIRFSVIGLVDDRMLFVTTPCVATPIASFLHEEPNLMKKGATTKYKLDPLNPPKTDWTEFDRMSEADASAAANSDPDCQPASAKQLQRARRVVDAKAVRQKLGLTQEQFAAQFGLPLGTIRDWEQGAHRPDRAAQILLAVIALEPEAVERAISASR